MTDPQNNTSEDFLALVSTLPGGEQVVACYQCGTCSGSCPAISAMDRSPREIMHLIQLGRGDDVLASRTPWVCASCYSCAVRCPREIDITDLMESLRRLAVERGVSLTRDTAFEDAFLAVVKRDGRAFELEMLLRYKLFHGPLDLIPQMPIALGMLRRGQLALLPHRIKGRGELGQLFRRWEERRQAP